MAEQREAGSAQRVVIVGAGPAGLLAALLLAKRGFAIDVVEKRGRPVQRDGELGDPERDDRAFFVMVHERGSRALRQVGLDPAALTASPTTGILRYSALQRAGAKKLAGRRIPITYTLLAGEQQDFVRVMADAAEAQHPGRITVHWGAEVGAVDLGNKTVRAVQAGDMTLELRYDLLVGADGWASVVRAAAAEQVPGFRASTEMSPVTRKLFNIPPHEELPLTTSAGGNLQWSFMSRTYGHSPTQGTMFLFPRAGRAGIRGVLAMRREGWEGLAAPGDYEALLAKEFPQLPPAIAREIAAQLPLRSERAYPTGVRVHCSALHGPEMVLLGDAAHGITPRTGNGMTAALEDAALLDQVVAEAGGDLGAVPERWTATRLPDAQALSWLDAQWMRRFGRGAWGRLDPACLSHFSSLVGRLLLHKAAPRLVAKPAVFGMNEGSISYRQAAAQMRRDDAVVGALAAGALAAAVLSWGRS